MELSLTYQIVFAVATGFSLATFLVLIVKKAIENGTKHLFDRLQTKVNHAFAERQSIVSTTHSAFASTRNRTSEFTQKSVQEVWRLFLEIKHNEPPVFLFLNILNADEIRKLPQNTNVNVRAAFAQTDIKKMLKLSAFSREPDQARLYVSERLWSFFIGYRTFVARITMIMTHELDHTGSSSIYFWDDNFTVDLLRELLGSDITKSSGTAYSVIYDLIESKFLEEARNIITGRAEITHVFEQAAAISAMSRELK